MTAPVIPLPVSGAAQRSDHVLLRLVQSLPRETGEHEARAVHGRLADDALEAIGAGGQLELQRGGLFGVESFNSYEVALHNFLAKNYCHEAPRWRGASG